MWIPLSAVLNGDFGHFAMKTKPSNYGSINMESDELRSNPRAMSRSGSIEARSKARSVLIFGGVAVAAGLLLWAFVTTNRCPSQFWGHALLQRGERRLGLPKDGYMPQSDLLPMESPESSNGQLLIHTWHE